MPRIHPRTPCSCGKPEPPNDLEPQPWNIDLPRTTVQSSRFSESLLSPVQSLSPNCLHHHHHHHHNNYNIASFNPPVQESAWTAAFGVVSPQPHSKHLQKDASSRRQTGVNASTAAHHVSRANALVCRARSRWRDPPAQNLPQKSVVPATQAERRLNDWVIAIRQKPKLHGRRLLMARIMATNPCPAATATQARERRSGARRPVLHPQPARRPRSVRQPRSLATSLVGNVSKAPRTDLPAKVALKMLLSSHGEDAGHKIAHRFVAREDTRGRFDVDRRQLLTRRGQPKPRPCWGRTGSTSGHHLCPRGTIAA